MRTRRSIALLLGLVLVAVVSASAQTSAPKKEPDVPFVPTPEKVVAEMLKMGKVNKNDVLFDLGSGDGRIVITAAQRFGTRGTGVELLPALVSEARENARKAGVADRVTFIEGDIFDAKIADATVVTLYLLPAVNMQLRPKLLKELRPGTRVVSHNYDMGDWKPERTVKMNVDGTEHTIYYWTIPRPSQ